MRGEKLLIARYLNYKEKIACRRNVKVNDIVSYPCISVRDRYQTNSASYSCILMRGFK